MCKLDDVQYFVEANDFERHALWNKWNEKVKWEQINEGFGGNVGMVAGVHQIHVSFIFAKIARKLVCFYHPTSQIVDHRVVKDYITKYAGDRMTDAQNFHTCVHWCERHTEMKVTFVCDNCGTATEVVNPTWYLEGCYPHCNGMHSCEELRPVFQADCSECGIELELDCEEFNG